MAENIIDLLHKDSALNEEVLKSLLISHGTERNDAIDLARRIYSDVAAHSITKQEMHVLADTVRFASKKQLFRTLGWFDYITDALSYTGFLATFGIFVWLIYEGQSRGTIDFGLHPFSVLAVVVIIVLFVSILEGSQIAIVNISDKDISTVSDQYPIACDIQKLTRTGSALQNYLIGRQLLVVASVIVFSLITSFPTIQQAFPNIWIPGPVDTIAFKLGFLNALVLLWFGQLIPQLFATRAPQTILNIRIVKLVVYMCLYLSRMKIAKPSSLVVDLTNVVEHAPPVSNFDNFMRNTLIFRHFLDSFVVNIEFHAVTDVKVKVVRKFVFEGDVERIIRRTVGIYNRIKKYKLGEVRAKRKDGSTFSLIDTGSEVEPIVKDKVTYFSHILEPQTSVFHCGDVVEMVDSFELEGLEQLDVRIDRPVRVMFVRCSIPDSILSVRNIKVPDLEVLISNNDRATETYKSEETIRVAPERKDGNIVVTFASLFPLLDSSFALSWNIGQDQ